MVNLDKNEAENMKHWVMQVWIMHCWLWVMFYEQHFLRRAHIFLGISNKITTHTGTHRHTHAHTEWWENDLGHLFWSCSCATALCIIQPLLNLYCSWRRLQSPLCFLSMLICFCITWDLRVVGCMNNSSFPRCALPCSNLISSRVLTHLNTPPTFFS